MQYICRYNQIYYTFTDILNVAVIHLQRELNITDIFVEGVDITEIQLRK